MEKKFKKKEVQKGEVMLHNFFKPITQDFEEESCHYCTYSEQDIDTYPCARCHTRH